MPDDKELLNSEAAELAVRRAFEEITQEEWIELGLLRNFAGPPVCVTHDGIPMDLDEEHEVELGGDPCIHMIRPYEDYGMLVEVEKNHAPSVWRKKGWI